MEQRFPKTTIIMVSYNRPLFVKEAITSLLRNPGTTDYELIVWDNNSNQETKDILISLQKFHKFKLVLWNENIASDATIDLLRMARGEYFVLTEDDMIWFQDNWLSNLVKGFETPSPITEEGKKLGYTDEWGILATNVLVDPVNNAGMWKSRLSTMIEVENNGITYWANIRAGGGALIFKTKRLIELAAFIPSKSVNGVMEHANHVYEQAHYPTGHIRDTYIYHACSPFYNQLYPDVWRLKQKGQTIEEGFKQWQETGQFNFDNEWILQILKEGKFSEYAEKLADINNRK